MNELTNYLKGIFLNKIIKSLLFIGSFSIFSYINAQIPEEYRLADWQYAGYHTENLSPSIQLNIKDFGAIGDGIADDTKAVTTAISFLNGRYGAIYFPEGIYKITQSLNLPDSCELQGLDSKRSQLLFDLKGHESPCIQATAEQNGSYISLNTSLSKGSHIVPLPTFHPFESGDHVEIIQDNGEWDAVPAQWASNAVGHLSRIINISGDTAWLAEGIRMNMDNSLNLRIRKISPIKHIRISCLGIERIDSAAFGYQIYLKYAHGVSISGVESRYSVGSHVMVEACSRVSICGNYFHHAFQYDGVSTHGYGVTLIQHTNLAKIENNIFQHLRHAMMVKQGVNGNVFAYNFATDTYREEIPNDLSGDISLHGHYPYANLFEGNIVNNIAIDHFWGPSGAGNTFLRNRTLDYGISSFNFNPNSPSTIKQIFIGNDITPRQLPKGLFIVDSIQNITYANIIRGFVIPSTGEMLEENSYYLEAPPTFWVPQLQWPSIGPPQSPILYKIPAQYRYEQKDTLTICNCKHPEENLEIPQDIPANISPAAIQSLVLNSAYFRNNRLFARIHSNQNTHIFFKVFDLAGRQIVDTQFLHIQGEQTYSFPIPSDFASGIYTIYLESKNNRISRKVSNF